MASESCQSNYFEFSSTSRPNPSSFQNSSSGFVAETSVDSSAWLTPLTARGYQTPEVRKETNQCQSCLKTFEFKNSFRRHVKRCKIRTGFDQRKRKLRFSNNGNKKKRNLFTEIPSISTSDSDTNGKQEDIRGKYIHFWCMIY